MRPVLESVWPQDRSEQFRPSILSPISDHNGGDEHFLSLFQALSTKTAHLKSFPLSSTALKGTIHEKDNVTDVDELHRFGKDLHVGRLGPRRLGRPAAIVRRCSARHYGDSGQRHS